MLVSGYDSLLNGSLLDQLPKFKYVRVFIYCYI
jgi:hypothetical protein